MTDIEAIYHAYFDDVFRYLLRLTKNRETAEDITSETFFKAMQSLERFRGDCDVRVWLCQIAKHCYISYRRKTDRLTGMDDAPGMDVPDTESSVEEQILKRDQAARVRDVLHRLAEPYREVFLWRVFAELSYREIGQIFRKSENWACVTYHRARAMIQERLEDAQHEK